MDAAEDDQEALSDLPWLTRWFNKDFSWSGLAAKPSWVRRSRNDTLQDFFRNLEGGVADNELFARGALISCGPGLYHVAFVPSEWATSGIADISADELEARKHAYWEKLFKVPGFSDRLTSNVIGAHLPKGLGDKLLRSEPRDFEWVRFMEPLSKLHRDGERSFADCQFLEPAQIKGAASTERRVVLRFYRCEFATLELSDSKDLKFVEFNECIFKDAFNIFECHLEKFRADNSAFKTFSISDTIFASPITFGRCDFVDFEALNCTFSDSVLLVDCRISSTFSLIGSDFEGRVTLSTIFWPTSLYHAASASGSKFNGIIVIEGGQFPPVQFFQDAEFKSNVSLNWFSDSAKTKSFHSELSYTPTGDLKGFDRGNHAQNVESGCRTLRKVSETAGDVHGEHMWHRNELIARRDRAENSFSENLFSFLYGTLADYGLSIARPLGALVLTTLIFGAIYGWLGGKAWFGTISWSDLGEGIAYSLNRTLPLAVFGDDRNPWRVALLGSGGQLQVIAIRFLASSQTVLSAILIYLSVMAVRRKFRIS